MSKGLTQILVTEDCILYINNQNIGRFPGGEYIGLKYPEGNYNIRVMSQHDSLIYIDTTYHFIPEKDTITNQLVIQLNNKVLDISRKLQPILLAIEYNMARIDGGRFTMGSKGGNNEESEHQVELLPYFISKYEITQEQYEAMMGRNPSGNPACKDCPVENLSWFEANEFIRVLNNLTQNHYRLPTEAEWEYAATGGPLSNKFMFSGGKKLDRQGWYYDNSDKKSHPVGKKAGNELGLVDMSGNVAEWCSDWYDGSFYNSNQVQNPKGPESGKEKVIRGGSWDDYDQACRVFSRNKKDPGSKDKRIGFRIVK
jgi:formylglycine-generating enzyme required for sulfatase activity